MTMINPEIYQYSISQAEENIINQQQAGFSISVCQIAKLMYSHILIHCIENKDIFTEEEKVKINYLISKVANGHSI